LFRLRRPSDDQIRALLAAQASEPFSYFQVGATRGSPPPGYDFDRHQVCLGSGDETWQRARAALAGWKMFPESMCRLCFSDAPLVEGTIVAVLIRTLGLWSVSTARIVYAFDERILRDGEEVQRFGFAYGTLPLHIERGEEVFAVERRNGDEVWYTLAAFSRPRHILPKLAYPYARMQQARFRRLSGQAMQAAVRG
jgi:uncharacterized protein (UPF0548 family)